MCTPIFGGDVPTAVRIRAAAAAYGAQTSEGFLLCCAVPQHSSRIRTSSSPQHRRLTLHSDGQNFLPSFPFSTSDFSICSEPPGEFKICPSRGHANPELRPAVIPGGSKTGWRKTGRAAQFQPPRTAPPRSTRPVSLRSNSGLCGNRVAPAPRGVGAAALLHQRVEQLNAPRLALYRALGRCVEPARPRGNQLDRGPSVVPCAWFWAAQSWAADPGRGKTGR